jgi:hypothetical protein
MSLNQFSKASQVISEDHHKIDLIKVFVPEKDARNLGYATINSLYAGIISIFKQGAEFQPVIKINGETYVFETDLKNIAYGAYSTIKALQEQDFFGNFHKILAVLYRKGNRNFWKQYQIESYNGINERDELFEKHMTADVAAGALVFFSILIRLRSKDSVVYSQPK